AKLGSRFYKRVNHRPQIEGRAAESAVAVCCCNDSRSSLTSRAFSMAMAASAAKVCNNAIFVGAGKGFPQHDRRVASSHRSQATVVAELDDLRKKPNLLVWLLLAFPEPEEPERYEFVSRNFPSRPIPWSRISGW